ncbi:serine acetyltransferase [Furfurilactobacillus sp. WILCCON 0119]
MTHFKTLFNLNCFSEDAAARALAAEQLQQQYNCEINCVQVDESVQFAHNGKGCTIAAAKLSAGVVIFQNVTIGANQTYNKATQRWENLGSPVLGKNVVVAYGVNKFKPRDVDHAPVFYKDMPNGEDIVAACNDVIARYEATTK